MIYTELTKKAMKIAFAAHEGQKDKSGLPYINHPLHVAEQMNDEDTCVVALLHDVAEDSDITIEELEKEGFTEAQIEAVRLITHNKNVPYLDYVKNLSTNRIAKTVKLADIEHNSDLTRLSNADEDDISRNRDKYEAAYKILMP
jgi:Guanosine polyphosphate pyrophosphohydrolases/synthetases